MVARGGSAKSAPRGAAGIRRDRIRKDRDGDLTMDTAVKGRSRVGKASQASAKKDLTSRTPKTGILSAGAQRAILRQAGAGDAKTRESRAGAPRDLVELKITGWNNSKASGNADGGVSSLISWLEKKASSKLGSRARNVKVKKSRVEGSDLILSVLPQDSAALLRISGWVWAGANVTVQRLGGAAEGSGTNKESVKEMLKTVLERRYNVETKLLDLTALAEDPELKSQAMFNAKSTASKFFPAMMVVLENAFDSAKDKNEAILSVTLANNGLTDLTVVSTLSQTLPQLRNLDLSNNSFDKLESLSVWRKRFAHLEQLIVTGNPLEQNEPNYVSTLIGWFPQLRMLNNVQVRTEEDIASRNKVTNLPFPIRTPAFQDEGGIAETFVRSFFTGFDTNREALAVHYYDDKSDFSYAVNTSALRDPTSNEPTEKQEWGDYIKNSRNLKKLQQLPARQHRMFRGAKAVADIFNTLPKTKHPDLATEARKWMIEAHTQPGVPDPSGQSPNGVDGFVITIHGEFDELDVSTVQLKKKRSFDRTFVIGPGGPSGVRIVNDMLTIRAYGGTQAFDPENMEGGNVPVPLPVPTTEPTAPTTDGVPQLPAGVTLEQAEQMVLELQKQTRMTIDYAKDCLEQVGWNFEMAVQAFESVKGNLPPNAFVPV